MCRGRRRAEHAHGAGAMKSALGMRCPQRAPDLARHLEPHRVRGEKLAAGAVQQFSDRDGGGHDRGRRMAPHVVVGVVEVQGVGGGAVGQRRIGGRRQQPRPGHRARTRTALGDRHRANQPCRFLVHTCQGHTERVEDSPAGDHLHRPRQVRDGGVGDQIRDGRRDGRRRGGHASAGESAKADSVRIASRISGASPMSHHTSRIRSATSCSTIPRQA